MKFQQLVEDVLQETTVIGGDASCMGPSVSDTATPVSGDNYARGNSKIVKSLYGTGVITRRGMIDKKGSKKSKKKK